MTEVLRSRSDLPSPPSPSLSRSPNDGPAAHLINPRLVGEDGDLGTSEERKRGRTRRAAAVVQVDGDEEEEGEEEEREREEQLSFLALLLALFRKSLFGCKTEGGEGLRRMEIGWPTNVRHIAHVTFDRLHGFLGLPVEFEPELPRRVPSASATVFGVSTESMQCSYDSRGNSIPTILLLLQRHLYEQGGLRAEGVFRINAENSQEEYVRDQLNNGVVPDGIDVHCLAGLIKAWFRELPRGLLDSIPPEQVMQCQSEEDCAQVAILLPQSEAALLDWAINLMADVVEEEQCNKMNARNIAMVFAPNMTQMSDPLTALMYAVQVMNFLKMLILKALRERQESNLEGTFLSSKDPSDENGDKNPQLPLEVCSEEAEPVYTSMKFPLDSPTCRPEEDLSAADSRDSNEDAAFEGAVAPSIDESPCEVPVCGAGSTSDAETAVNGCNAIQANPRRSKTDRDPSHKRTRKAKGVPVARAVLPAEKSRGTSIVSRINSKSERIEAWR